MVPKANTSNRQNVYCIDVIVYRDKNHVDTSMRQEAREDERDETRREQTRQHSCTWSRPTSWVGIVGGLMWQLGGPTINTLRVSNMRLAALMVNHVVSG